MFDTYTFNNAGGTEMTTVTRLSDAPSARFRDSSYSRHCALTYPVQLPGPEIILVCTFDDQIKHIDSLAGYPNSSGIRILSPSAIVYCTQSRYVYYGVQPG